MLHDGGINSAVFSPNGKFILTAGQDYSARLWSAVNQKQIGPSMRHQESNTSIGGASGVGIAVFSPDGKIILTAGMDKTAQLWETGTGTKIGPSMQHDDFIISAVFSPDGKYVFTRCYEGTTHLWNIETDLDIPSNLFKLQATIISGMAFNLQTSENFYVPSEEWYKLKEEYNYGAREHFKKCKYPEHNFWRCFNIDEAIKIRPELNF